MERENGFTILRTLLLCEKSTCRSNSPYVNVLTYGDFDCSNVNGIYIFMWTCVNQTRTDDYVYPSVCVDWAEENMTN